MKSQQICTKWPRQLKTRIRIRMILELLILKKRVDIQSRIDDRCDNWFDKYFERYWIWSEWRLPIGKNCNQGLMTDLTIVLTNMLKRLIFYRTNLSRNPIKGWWQIWQMMCARAGCTSQCSPIAVALLPKGMWVTRRSMIYLQHLVTDIMIRMESARNVESNCKQMTTWRSTLQ